MRKLKIMYCEFIKTGQCEQNLLTQKNEDKRKIVMSTHRMLVFMLIHDEPGNV